MTKKIEISHKTIIFILALLAALWVLLQIRDILFLLFISFILMTALRPLVDILERIKIPRMLAIFTIYGVVFGVFGVSIASFVPTLAVQSQKLIGVLPDAIERLLPYWNIDEQMIANQIGLLGENFVRLTVSIFSNFVTLLTVSVFTFYFLLERKHTEDFIRNIAGDMVSARAMTLIGMIERRLGQWVRGQLTLMLLVGSGVYVGLLVLGVDFALPLAIIAGVLEIVPTIGPILSAVPAVLLGLTISPLFAASVAALYFIVQQLENNVIVPMVMKKSVGLSPLITILTLMIGARFAGITGAILGVPILLVIQEVFTFFSSFKKRAEQ